MKRVVLLGDDRPLWGEVERILRDVHADVVTPEAGWSPEEVIALSPDMIVTSVQGLRHMKIGLRRIPKVAVRVEPEEERLLPASRLEWNLEVVAWSAGREEFLQVTSRQLAISPRKTFACIVRLVPEGGGPAETAQTVNMSMTGLAFKAIVALEVGQCLGVVLNLPGERHPLEARVRIVRGHGERDEDPRTLYGAEYLGPTEAFSRAMKRFIHVY